MTKYIKGKDGKFAGSIGDGKASVPTPAPTARVMPVTALFGALRDNPQGSVRLDEVAQAYHESQTTQPAEKKPALADLYFGSQVAEPEVYENAADWGDGIVAAIESEPVESFQDNFLSSANIYRSGEEYVIDVYDDGEDTTATIRYSPSYNIAFVETYTAEDYDFHTTEDLAPQYRDAIKEELTNNRRQIF